MMLVRVVCLSSTSHCTPNNPLDFSRLPGQGFNAEQYHGWAAYQQSRLACILFSQQLQLEFAAANSGATSVAVAELDTWFIDPRLLLDDDKEAMAAGPASTLAVLGSEHAWGAHYVVDSRSVSPGEHAQSAGDAEALWAYSLTRG